MKPPHNSHTAQQANEALIDTFEFLRNQLPGKTHAQLTLYTLLSICTLNSLTSFNLKESPAIATALHITQCFYNRQSIYDCCAMYILDRNTSSQNTAK